MKMLVLISLFVNVSASLPTNFMFAGNTDDCTYIISGSAGTVSCSASTCSAARECAHAGYEKL